MREVHGEVKTVQNLLILHNLNFDVTANEVKR